MRLYVSWSGITFSRRWWAAVVLAVSLALVAAAVPGPVWAQDPPGTDKTELADSDAEPTDAIDSDGDEVLERPDVVSAAVTARMSGKPVEAVSGRTESGRQILMHRATQKATFTNARSVARSMLCERPAGDDVTTRAACAAAER